MHAIQFRLVSQAYGKTAYLVTTLKVVPRGTEGAVSLEGTAAGMAAAALFAGLAFALNLVSYTNTVLYLLIATCSDTLTRIYLHFVLPGWRYQWL